MNTIHNKTPEPRITANIPVGETFALNTLALTALLGQSMLWPALAGTLSVSLSLGELQGAPPARASSPSRPPSCTNSVMSL